MTKGWQDKYLIRSVPSHPTFTCPPQHVAQCLAHSGHAVKAICFQVGRTVSKTENYIHPYKLFSKSKPSALLSFSVQMIKPFYTGSPHNLVPDSTGKLIPDPTGLHSNLDDRCCYTGLSLSLHFRIIPDLGQEARCSMKRAEDFEQRRPGFEGETVTLSLRDPGQVT